MQLCIIAFNSFDTQQES